jgi:glucose-6-phosphate isomerase
MHVDIGNALAEVASPGVSRGSLERLDERVATAHERIERGRAEREHGYAALALPETADVAAVRAATDGFDPETVLVVGIGGSALGAATLTAGLDTDADARYLDNVDPEHLTRLLAAVDLSETVVNVVSRSGTTTETLANFLVVREAMESAGVDWTERTLVTTGESGPLADLAATHDLPTLAVPDGVPGRFGVLSTVGLAPAALSGIDPEAVLSGAREVELTGSLFDCPAYAYGAVSRALAVRGADVTAMMPYAERLETYAEWFAQLWAESLGKDGLGQTPARALGATDQHSQLQLYRAGPRNAMVTFVAPQDRPELTIPPAEADALSHLGGAELGAVLDAELAATEASLAAADRPSVRAEIPRVDAPSLGALLYEMEAACVLAGELAGVDTFVQPAVEWGKRATKGLLGEATAESAAVAEKTELRVE